MTSFIKQNLPYWEQLPNIDLYLDQVLVYVNQVISQQFEEPQVVLTASMVNNYVKQGYIPKPIKKKYGPLHIARLLVITSLKPVFSIQEIWQAIEGLQMEPAVLYNHFVNAMAQEENQAPEIIQAASITLAHYYQTRHLLNQFQQEEAHVSHS